MKKKWTSWKSEAYRLSGADTKWLRAYGYLVEFKKRFRRWPTPVERYPGRFGLGQWMYRNRCQYFTQTLAAHRLRKLEDIGCPVDPIRYHDQYWDYQLRMLRGFRRQHPDRWPYTAEEYPKGNKLGRWLREQRIKLTRGTLKKKFRILLKAVGFPLKSITHHAELWQRQYLALKAFRARHPDKWPDSGVLGRWCCSQRSRRAAGRLNRSKIRLLNKMGFDWNTKVSRWLERYDQLAEYMRTRKGASPKADSPKEFERVLANWLAFQRSRNRRGLLEPYRLNKLNRLGLGLPRNKNV